MFKSRPSCMAFFDGGLKRAWFLLVIELMNYNNFIRSVRFILTQRRVVCSDHLLFFFAVVVMFKGLLVTCLYEASIKYCERQGSSPLEPNVFPYCHANFCATLANAWHARSSLETTEGQIIVLGTLKQCIWLYIYIYIYRSFCCSWYFHEKSSDPFQPAREPGTTVRVETSNLCKVLVLTHATCRFVQFLWRQQTDWTIKIIAGGIRPYLWKYSVQWPHGCVS